MIGLVGDIKSTMESLLPRLKPKTSTAFRDKVAEFVGSVRDVMPSHAKFVADHCAAAPIQGA